MSGRYPIIRHREPFFWWNVLRRRPLAAGPGQALVCLLGGDSAVYVEGAPEGAMARRVLAVSTVDVRRDVPIRAECHVAANQSWYVFPVMATFHCTVVNPVTVVRSRRAHAIQNMDAYLQGILKAASTGHGARDELSLERTLTEVLRRRLASTPIPGVRIALASLDVKPACPTDPGEA